MIIRWLTFSFVIIILDQITKLWIVDTLALHQSWSLIPLVNFTLVHNFGVAFGFLNQAEGGQRWFFIAVSSIVSIILIIWISKLPKHHLGTALSLSLILGGAIGNLIDRIRLGYVIDFIDLYIGSYHWPAFNIADSAITIGAILLIIVTFNHKTDQE